MPAFKLLTEWFFILAISVLLILNDLVLYGIQQAYGQFNLLYSTIPIEEVLSSNEYPDSVKQKILFINEVKKYATDSLGLNESENYTSYYDQHNKPALWVITASEAYKLKAKEWWFPVIGSVSYKGFFKKERGVKTKNELIKEGYDVELGPVSAWSTLGFFNDPILSNMLKKPEGELANLIIHELTHGTIYAKSSVDFNENLASFIGDKGAIQFLKFKYGVNSEQLKEYMQEDTDDKTYNNYILECINKLTTFYESLNTISDEKTKLSKKDSMIAAIVNNVDSLNLIDKTFYKSISKRALVSKNAFFLNFEMYDSKQDELENEFTLNFNSDIKKYIAYIKEKYSK